MKQRSKSQRGTPSGRQNSMTDSQGNEIGKLFIGGLPQSATNDALQSFFETYGQIEEASVMMDQRTGRSRGFGYVKFADAESVIHCLQAKPHYLDGKEIDAKPCNVRMKGRNRRNLKIFVGGIRPEQTEETLKAFFEEYGTVTDVSLMMDQLRQRHRGFAFIGFEDETVVRKLIDTKFLDLNGRRVEIKKMEPPNFDKRPLTYQSNCENPERSEQMLRPQPLFPQPPTTFPPQAWQTTASLMPQAWIPMSPLPGYEQAWSPYPYPQGNWFSPAAAATGGVWAALPHSQYTVPHLPPSNGVQTQSVPTSASATWSHIQPSSGHPDYNEQNEGMDSAPAHSGFPIIQYPMDHWTYAHKDAKVFAVHMDPTIAPPLPTQSTVASGDYNSRPNSNQQSMSYRR